MKRGKTKEKGDAEWTGFFEIRVEVVCQTEPEKVKYEDILMFQLNPSAQFKHFSQRLKTE